MDSIALWLQAFTYPTIFVGGFLEGETVTILAAYLAVHGELNLALPTVAAVSALGAYAGHVVFFFIGRTQGQLVIKKFPHMEIHTEQARAFLRRWGTLGIFTAQYIYGLRIAFAIVIGISEISITRFLILQAISCAIWGTLITTAGALFGTAIQQYLGEYDWVKWVFLGVIVGLAILSFIWHLRRDAKARAEYARRQASHPPHPAP